MLNLRQFSTLLDSPTSRGCLVPLHFLLLECYHLHIWGGWYFFQAILILACDSSKPTFHRMYLQRVGHDWARTHMLVFCIWTQKPQLYNTGVVSVFCKFLKQWSSDCVVLAWRLNSTGVTMRRYPTIELPELTQDRGNRLLEGTNKTRTQEKGEWPHKRLNQTCLWVSRSLQLRCVSVVAYCRVGGTECSGACMGPFEGGCHYLHYVHHSFSQFSSVQSLSHVRLFVTPWSAARQASLSIINSRSSLRLKSIESVMPSSHLILSSPYSPALNPSQHQSFPMSQLFAWGGQSFSFSIIPSKEIPGLISFRMDWLDLLAVQGTLKSLLQYHS